MHRWIVLALLLGCACRSPASAADVMRLRYGETASTWKSIFSLPVRIADAEGFFTRHGLKFELVPVDGGGESTLAALEAGEADVAHVATSFLVTGALHGRTTVAIAAEFANPIYSLVAKPWFKRIEDLKGRRVGMADLTGSVSLATLALFRKHGLTAADLDMRVIEGTSPRYQCLTLEDCDAVPLGQPQDFYAQRQGFNILGATDEAVPAFVYTVTAAQRDWAAQHPELMVRYIRALRDAFRFIRAPENRTRMIAHIRAFWSASDDSADGIMKLYFQPERHVLPMRGEIDPEGLQQVIRFLAEGGVLKGPAPPFDRLVELRYLTAADGPSGPGK